jgi:bifunctional DNase/RNase
MKKKNNIEMKFVEKIEDGGRVLPVVILKEIKEIKGIDPRKLQICVVPFESVVIDAITSNQLLKRSITHQLLNNTIKGLEAEIESVVITDFKKIDGSFVFLSNIVIAKKNGKTILIDARPSDAVILAMLDKKPIYVEPIVFEKCEKNLI